MCSGGGSDKEAKRARKAEEERQEDITKSRGVIDQRFEDFDGGFFDKLRNTARDFYQPQFDDQFDDARRKLRFGLARSGNSLSSAGAESLGDLGRDRTLGLARVEDLSTNAVEKQREFLENQRQQMYSSAAAATDPKAAASQSINRSDFLSQTPEFNPIGTLFEGVLNQAATYQQAENRGDRLGFGAFGFGGSSPSGPSGSSHSVKYGG